MAANTPFKKLVCQICRQWKIDRTGKAKAEHCGVPMVLSDNWYVRVTVRGQTTTKSVSPRKRDAEDYIANCKTASRQGVILPGKEKDIPWGQAKENCLKWWKGDVPKNIKASTFEFYQSQVLALDSYFSGKTLFSITKGDVMDFQTERSKEGILPSTVNHNVRALKRMFSMHVERTSSVESPKLCGKCMDISLVKDLPKSKKKARFLTAEECSLLLEKAVTEQVRVASLIALNTGLRKSNVLDLTWGELVLSKKTISLPAEKMKSGKPHVVDIPDHLIPILQKWRGGNVVSPLVFPPQRFTFATDWDNTMKACGFTDVSFHKLRHSFASHFLMNGGDLSTLSDIMDHSSIQITKDLYGHLSRDHKTRAVQQFAESFLSKL